jgi:[acyl-carrier-protein] S-malonyltransferase
MSAGAARLAILCPGQGGQHAGMFDLLREDVRAADLIAGAGLAAALGHAPVAVLAEDGLLFANRQAQPLVVAATLAAWEMLRDALPQPALVAGYSIGELAAYSVAGALSAPDAIAIAAQRATFRDACAAAVPQGLMSVAGFEVRAAQALLQAHGAHVAIETDFDKLIAGGTQAALLAAQTDLESRGAHTGRLPVSVASHTPLMQAAAHRFAALLADARFADPAVAVLAGYAIRDRRAAQAALVQQLTATVRWSACMDACAENGITVALELGPGAALSRMLRARHPGIACRSVSEFRSIRGVLSWLAREMEY